MPAAPRDSLHDRPTGLAEPERASSAPGGAETARDSRASVEISSQAPPPGIPDFSCQQDSAATADYVPSSTDFDIWEGPRQIGPFRILKELGRGGMGVVYLARQEGALPRNVALKMIHPDKVASDTRRTLFEREGAAVARLQHPNIVTVFEAGEEDGQPYFSFEYVDGGSLAQWLKHHKPTVREAATLMEKLALAVEHAHQKGIVHLDLKPGNVLLGFPSRKGEDGSAGPRSLDDAVPKIADYGLARFLDDPSERMRDSRAGTPAYMPPEQARGLGEQIGPQADVYALGAILFELLTGQPPFQGKNYDELILRVLRDAPPSPRSLTPSIPTKLAEICVRCLDKEPETRFANAKELADAIRGWLDDRARRATRRRTALTAVAVLTVGLSTVLLSIVARDYYSSPDRHLEWMKSELGAGRAVKIDTSTLPKWSRWKAGLTQLLPDPLRFRANLISMLELMDEVPIDNMRFSVEVLEQNLSTEDIGIFFGCTREDDAEEYVHRFSTLSIHNDSGSPRVAVRGRRYHEEQTLTSSVNLADAPTTHVLHGLTDFTAFAHPLGHSPLDAPVWHTLDIDLGTMRPRIHCDGIHVGDFSFQGIDRFVDLKLKLLAKTEEGPRRRPAKYSSRGAFGLYVAQGMGRFRNIKLERVPD